MGNICDHLVNRSRTDTGKELQKALQSERLAECYPTETLWEIESVNRKVMHLKV